MTYDQQYIKILESLGNRQIAEQRIKDTIENLVKDRKKVQIGNILDDNNPYHSQWWDYTHAILDLNFFQDDLDRVWDKDI